MNALKKLSELDRMDKAVKYDSVPEYALPKTKFSDATANKLTRAVIQWLTLNGHWATRISSTGRWIKGESVVDVIGRNREMKGHYIPGQTQKGTADIHSVIHGKHASIEIKIGSDKMSKYQKLMKRDIEKAGGLYFIANDFDSFLKWYQSIACQTMTTTDSIGIKHDAVQTRPQNIAKPLDKNGFKESGEV